MTDFVIDDLPLPGPKSQWDGVSLESVAPDMFCSSADFNALRSASLSLRSYVKQGLSPGAYNPAAVTVGPNGNITAVSAGTGGGVTDGNKGDVTVASSGTAWTVNTLPENRISGLTADLSALAAAIAAEAALARNADNLTSGHVVNARLDVMPANTIKLNNTGSPASPIDGTVAQLLALLGIRLGEFGTGDDGVVTMDGSTAVAGCSRSGSVYTATRTCFFDTLTINVGVTFKPDGWPIYVKTLTTNNGDININGGDASGATNGAAAVSGSRILPVNLSIGNPSTNAPQTFVASAANNFGAAGLTGGASGADGIAGTKGRGGGGGAGGNNFPFTAQGADGGNGPTVSLATDVAGDVRVKQQASTGKNLLGTQYTLGTAGGGGGVGGAGTVAGGAGAAGGWMFFASLAVAGSGTWRAIGGNGGAGTSGGPGIGGAGGGAGGSGGFLVLELGGGTPPTLTINGGAGGARGLGGSGGAGNGGNGAAGGLGSGLVL